MLPVGNIYMYNAIINNFLYFQDKESMLRVMQVIDKANGYVFGDLEERNIQEMLSYAAGANFEYDKIQNVREKYMDTDSKLDDVNNGGGDEEEEQEVVDVDNG
jgi:cyclopropane fatty-acyl-phospholipid synthase-like methyltransferase